ncbi:hypothetical protein [Kineobactrum salinum]|uniref:VWA domain-containing protein n=1 Tax=Kineobactrum salinum TaxID=2708301 RepID=A0A6C0TYQ5_9GAMM|nr:hypothetical protein [Kineobactrum salinum]QIB64778.1 hypothetical protein G3T16_04630 [Kineobactrum salinum]
MKTKSAVNKWCVALGAVLVLSSHALPAGADDTEIYQVEVDVENTGRPKVLIVFDDSGSMGTVVTNQRPPTTPLPPMSSISTTTKFTGPPRIRRLRSPPNSGSSGTKTAVPSPTTH